MNLRVLKTLNTLEDGVWFVSDLHLSDRELNSTYKMVENSDIILENIKQKLIDNPTIKVVVLLGDIQHRIPADRRQIIQWMNKLREIRTILEDRMPDNLVVYKGEEVVNREDINPLISLKGNHDYDKRSNYTFFDELEDLEFIGRYTKFIYGDNQYNLYDYGKGNLGLDNVYKKEDNVNKVIGAYHDTFAYVGCPKWMEDDAKEGKAYTLDDLEGLDVAIVGHIHDREEPIKHKHDNGTETLFWYPGCIARTQHKESTRRDKGYSGLIDNNSLRIYECDIDVIKPDEYFKTLQREVKKSRENTLKDFNLKLEENIIDFDSYEDEINSKEMEDNVKERSISLIQEVERERISKT